MEAELRAIVAEAVSAERHREVGLAEAIRRRFAPVGGVDDAEAAMTAKRVVECFTVRIGTITVIT